MYSIPAPVPLCFSIAAVLTFPNLGIFPRTLPKGERNGLSNIATHRIFELLETDFASALFTSTKVVVPNAMANSCCDCYAEKYFWPQVFHSRLGEA